MIAIPGKRNVHAGAAGFRDVHEYEFMLVRENGHKNNLSSMSFRTAVWFADDDATFEASLAGQGMNTDPSPRE
jgi:hypothetical protein